MKAGEVLFIVGLLVTCGAESPEPSSVLRIVAIAALGIGIMTAGVWLIHRTPRRKYFHERS